jgi:hypothetical protein
MEPLVAIGLVGNIVQFVDFSSKLISKTAEGGKSKWKSFRKALRSVWSKEKVLEIERRLSTFRDEINLRIVVDLR